MPVSLPYLASNKNVGALFDSIASAKVPPKFTQDFLQTTIGLKGTNDRSLIPLLRTMGFLDQSGTPLPSYSLLKGDDRRVAIAKGIKAAYEPLFDSNDRANEQPPDKLKSLIAQVAGSDDDMTGRIASTFTALVKLGDFKSQAAAPKEEKDKDPGETKDDAAANERERKSPLPGMRTEFHYDIHIHLPANGTEETYQNIFHALRKTFQ